MAITTDQPSEQAMPAEPVSHFACAVASRHRLQAAVCEHLRHFSNFVWQSFRIFPFHARFGTRIYLPLVCQNLISHRSLFFSKRERANMKRIFAKFVADETGATAIEYGLIAAGISIAIIVAVNGLGSNLNTKFNSINTSLK
jgi:pilus assembly protein Flp/PilA